MFVNGELDAFVVENTDGLCPPFMMFIKLLGCLEAVDGEDDNDMDELVEGFRLTFLQN